MKRKKAKKKLIVGLTGGFASGKSTVRLLFKTFGAKTFDCDAVAHEALKKQTPTYRKIIRTFGKEVLSTNGQIDRQKLGDSVFGNKRKKKELENIVHPYVRKRMETFIKEKSGLLVIEVPLLFESKLERFFDVIVVVFCSQRECVERAKKRFPYLTKKQLLLRIKTQLSLSYKRKKADIVIINNHRKKVVKQVGELTRLFKKTLKNRR